MCWVQFAFASETMPDNTQTDPLLAQLDRFRHDCEQCPAEGESDCLREALRLFPAIAEVSVKTLISDGGFASAALAMIGPDTPFMLSRSSQGHCLATIAQHGWEVTAEGATPALALLGAWASALLACTSGSSPASAGTAGAPDLLH